MNSINDVKEFLKQDYVVDSCTEDTLYMYREVVSVLQELPEYSCVNLKLNKSTFAGTPKVIGTVLFAYLIATDDWEEELELYDDKYHYIFSTFDMSTPVVRYKR